MVGSQGLVNPRAEPTPERHDYRDHLVEKSDVVATWAVAIGLFFILTVVA